MTPFAPLPGTTPAPRALFIDRWGTLLETPERGHAESADELTFYPGALDSLFRAVRAGWKVYLLGNEDAVAYGRLPHATWKEVEAAMFEQLERAAIPIAGHYACTSRQDGIDDRSADSVYLLPNTGAFYHAAHTDGIDLANSWVIGDSTLELVAGWRSGCRMAGVRTGLGLTDATFHVEPEFLADDLVAVLDLLVQRAAVSA